MTTRSPRSPVEHDGIALHSELALRKGSLSFNAAARFLEPNVRESVRLLYAWCRHVDDVIDGQSLGHSLDPGSPQDARPQVERLAEIRAATEAANRGEPQSHPAFEALRRVMARHAIPVSEPLTLIDGCGMDVEGRVYETLNDTIDYGYHVAGVVGLMMARVLDVRDERLHDRACDLGIGFQLTNIARDVIEDHAAGRIYLPRRWLAEEGLDALTMARPENRERLHRVASRLLAAAEPYYDSAKIGIDALPARSAWAIGTAWSVYRAIGTKVIEAGPAAWDRRMTVPRRTKGRFALSAGVQALIKPRRAPDRSPRSAELWSRPC